MTASNSSYLPPSLHRRSESHGSEFEEVELSEIERTSLSTSMEELIAQHHRQETARLQHAQLDEAQTQAQAQENKRIARKLEIDVMHREMLARREIRIGIRQEEARREAQRVARLLKFESVAQQKKELSSLGEAQLLERSLATLRRDSGRNQVKGVLRAAILLACLGGLAGGGLLAQAQKKNEMSVSSLQQSARQVEIETQARIDSLTENLKQGRRLLAEERESLEKQLLNAKLEHKSALDSQMAAERTPSIRKIRVATKGKRAAQAPSVSPKTVNPVPDTSAADLFVAGICAEGDPLCSTL